jgi:hypothetical protein
MKSTIKNEKLPKLGNAFDRSIKNRIYNKNSNLLTNSNKSYKRSNVIVFANILEDQQNVIFCKFGQVWFLKNYSFSDFALVAQVLKISKS